jgi:hypothetical protein
MQRILDDSTCKLPITGIGKSEREIKQKRDIQIQGLNVERPTPRPLFDSLLLGMVEFGIRDLIEEKDSFVDSLETTRSRGVLLHTTNNV